MNSSETVDEINKSSGDNEGFTAIASASSQTTDSPRNVNLSSAESTEADTTFDNYFVTKSSVDTQVNQVDENESVLSKQLKELINLQLDLIEYQQVKITNKDKQILLLKSEKEQLEARICRMERRLALQKRHIDLDENPGTKSKVTKTNTQTSAPATPTIATKTESQKYECQLPVTVTSRTDKDFKFRSSLRTNLNYLDIIENRFLSKHQKPSEVIKKAEKSEAVSVPSWKIIERKVVSVKDGPEEDCSNDAFAKRHLKPEQEEKRRKRWDLQHIRQQQQHEHLAEQVNNKNRRGKNIILSEDENFNSLYPNAENIVAVEINNTVPVCAFGYPVPMVSMREMELPWFSIAKKEVQVRQAKEKMMKKNLAKRCANKKKHLKY